MEHNAKNVLMVTMETRSSQAAAASGARVITTLIWQRSATVTNSPGDVSLACTTPQASVVSAANPATMVMLLLGIAQVGMTVLP